MSKEFSRTFRVRWSETNANGQVTLANYWRYLIETAWDWGATGGLSIAENEALGIAWVVREAAVKIIRPLTANDVFDFTIWLMNWRRVRGTRCFELRLHDSNEVVAQGVQQVATLDSNTLRPMRVDAGLLENFLMENPRVIQHEKFPKFKLDAKPVYTAQRVVEWRDLDVLEHVNNAVYADFAEETAVQALADLGWSPAAFKDYDLMVVNQRFHIQYQAPALWGDELSAAVYLAELNPGGGTWFIEIRQASDSTAVVGCVLEWSLVDGAGGEGRMLPKGLYAALEKTAVSIQ